MKKIGTWFQGLTRTGKFGVMSAAALSFLVVGSAMGSSGTTIPAAETTQAATPVIATKTETETQEVPFEKQTVELASLAKGQTQLQTAGRNGTKTLTHTITLTDGVETNRQTKEEVTLQPVHEVTRVGTYVAPAPVSNCDPNYSGCVPVVSVDLDCPDIGFTVQVLGSDRHRFDGNNDGWGCESYS